MAFTLEDPETEALLRRLAELTGNSLERAAHDAFERQLRALRLESGKKRPTRTVREIVSFARSLPVLHSGSSKEITDSLWEDA